MEDDDSTMFHERPLGRCQHFQLFMTPKERVPRTIAGYVKQKRELWLKDVGLEEGALSRRASTKIASVTTLSIFQKNSLWLLAKNLIHLIPVKIVKANVNILAFVKRSGLIYILLK